MALVSCSECHKEVSDRASACPHCGNPMNAPVATPTAIETRPGDAVTIEATAKTYKILEAVGAGIFLLGLVSCTYVRELSAGPVLLIFTGSAIYIAASIGAWWHHA